MDTDADLDKAAAWVMSDEYRIWSNDLALKRMQDYVQRGRKHANLSDKDALLQWRYRVVLHSQDPVNSMRFRDYMDIDCELTLRELDPPLMEMRQELAAVGKYLKTRCEELQKDPAEWKRRGDEMIADITASVMAFEDAKDRFN